MPTPAVSVEIVHVGPYQMNCYLVYNAETGETLVVDPGAESEKIVAALGERKPAAVLLTHAHYDHFGAADALCERYGAPLYVHEDDAPKLTDPALNGSTLEPDTAGLVVSVRTRPTLLRGDDAPLELAGLPLRVLHTPGHTSGSVCFLLPGGAGVLCGDTLFAHGYGRYDLPTGDFHALKQSLRRLISLRPRMVAYPGHEGAGLVGTDGGDR